MLKVMTLDDVPTALYLTSGKNCIELTRHWNNLDKLETALVS
jgi:hypothetical protein